MNFDEISGRQLDLAVARHVFRHDVEEQPNLRTGEVDAVYSPRVRTSNATWVRVPLYSKTPAATNQVEVELQKQGWKKMEEQASEENAVRVILGHPDGRTVEAFGPASEAICRAALKAVHHGQIAC